MSLSKYENVSNIAFLNIKKKHEKNIITVLLKTKKLMKFISSILVFFKLKNKKDSGIVVF